MHRVCSKVQIFLFGRRGESGAALAEFAIFTPILAMMLVGIAGLASYFIQLERLNSAVEAGLLHVTKNGWSWNDAANVSNVTSAATSAGGGSVSVDNVACIYGCPTEGGIIPVTNPDCTGPAAPDPSGTCTGGVLPGQYVTVTVSTPITIPVAGSFLAFFGVALPTTATLTARTRAK